MLDHTVRTGLSHNWYATLSYLRALCVELGVDATLLCDGCRRVVFQPYTRQQLETIAKTRLEGLDVFEGRAIEYAARKVLPHTALVTHGAEHAVYAEHAIFCNQHQGVQ